MGILQHSEIRSVGAKGQPYIHNYHICRHTTGRTQPGFRAPARRAWHVLCAGFALWLLCLSGSARAHTPGQPYQLVIERLSLANGLRVVMNVDPHAPRAIVAISYQAGDGDQAEGKRGVKPLLEQLMFAGSPQVAAGRHRRIIESVGGRSLVLRSRPVTTYANVVPPEYVQTAMWLEAQRLAELALSQTSLDQARTRLKQLAARHRFPGLKRNQRLAAQMSEHLLGLTMLGNPHYGGDHLADLDRISVSDVRAFHQTAYSPGRAVLTIVGNFNAVAIRKAAARFFGTIERPTMPPATSPPLARQRSRRSMTLRSNQTHQGMLGFSWAIPGRNSEHHAALALAGEVLAGGRAGLIQRELLHTGQLLGSSARTHELPNQDILSLQLTLPRDIAPGKVAVTVDRLIRQLRRSGPREAALRQAKARIIVRHLLELEKHSRRAQLLGEYELLNGDANALSSLPRAYLGVDREQVRTAIQSFMKPHLSSVVESVAAPIYQRVRKPKKTKSSAGKGKQKTKKTRSKKKRRKKRSKPRSKKKRSKKHSKKGGTR